MEFILRGETIKLTREGVEKAVKGKKPGPIRKYAIRLYDKEYPIKQVLSLAVHRSVAEFTAHDAYRILRKLDFGIINYD
jgi:hypothetical protein